MSHSSYEVGPDAGWERYTHVDASGLTRRERIKLGLSILLTPLTVAVFGRSIRVTRIRPKETKP